MRQYPAECHTYAKGDDQYPIAAPGFTRTRRGLPCVGRRWERVPRIRHGLASGDPRACLSARRARGSPGRWRSASNDTRPAAIEVESARRSFSALFSELRAGQVRQGRIDGHHGGDQTGPRLYRPRHRWPTAPTSPSSPTTIGSSDFPPRKMAAGIPEPLSWSLTTTFRYNDIGSLREVFARVPRADRLRLSSRPSGRSRRGTAF